MIFIENTEDLSAFCQKLAEKPFIAVDTEFIRERSFYPKLCLIQVAAEGIEGIIDPKAKGINLEPFFDLLQNESVMKVFHACSQDVEIFFLLTGSVPKPLFDTQIAAMVCSMGTRMSDSFKDYLRPLVQGEVKLVYKDGIAPVSNFKRIKVK